MADSKNLIKKALWPNSLSNSSGPKTSNTSQHETPPKIAIKDVFYSSRPSNPPNTSTTTSPSGTPLPKMRDVFARRKGKGSGSWWPHKYISTTIQFHPHNISHHQPSHHDQFIAITHHYVMFLYFIKISPYVLYMCVNVIFSGSQNKIMRCNFILVVSSSVFRLNCTTKLHVGLFFVFCN